MRIIERLNPFTYYACLSNRFCVFGIVGVFEYHFYESTSFPKSFTVACDSFQNEREGSDIASGRPGDFGWYVTMTALFGGWSGRVIFEL